MTVVPETPHPYFRVKGVASLDELLSARFRDGINALCWRRTLEGDFDEVALAFGINDGITTIDEDSLQELRLSPAGNRARNVLLADQRSLSDAGLDPNLDLVPGYEPDFSSSPVPTDVCSYHVDSATAEADTILCSYNQACTEGLSNEGATRRIDIPETRRKLLALYGGADDEGFATFCRERCFDHHYLPNAGVVPYSFGIGNIWRIATRYPSCPVPPCIHRAPITSPNNPPRLLLIS